ncbi:MAG: ATP-binding protein, partial [Nitrospirae bacterium]|nr:ATP-binding protein [Nitrospirota bacterium]
MKTNAKQKIKMQEGQKAEMKARISEDIGKSICAFANTNDGMILIGISEDKKIVGIGKDDEAKIANIASSCDPPIRIKTEVLSIEDKDILLVQVKKSDKIHSFKGKVYVRVGSTN